MATLRVLGALLFLMAAPVQAQVDHAWYGSVGAAWKIDELTDPLINTRCFLVETVRRTLNVCGGRNPTADFEVGHEWRRRHGRVRPLWQVYLHHTSHYRDGWPFNANPETYVNKLGFRVKFGGLK